MWQGVDSFDAGMLLANKSNLSFSVIFEFHSSFLTLSCLFFKLSSSSKSSNS